MHTLSAPRKKFMNSPTEDFRVALAKKLEEFGKKTVYIPVLGDMVSVIPGTCASHSPLTVAFPPKS